MSARVSIDPAELRRELLAATVPGRTEVALLIVDDYRATAPIETGAFRADAEVVVEGTSVRVVDDNDDSQFIEYGTSDTPPHATLTNAARRHGRYTGWKPR